MGIGNRGLGIEKYSRTYFDLIEAFKQPDCAVCRLIDDAVYQYIDIFIYENITNVARRQEIREARLFCSLHTTKFMSGYGRLISLATLEQDVLNDVLRSASRVLANPLPKHWRVTGFLRGASRALRRVIRPTRNCTLCDYEHSMERVMLGTLIQFIDEPDIRASFEGSAGLCMPHYYMGLGMSGRHERIITVQQAVMTRVKADIDEYVRKRNPLYRDQDMNEDEAAAPTRAAKLISGRIVHSDGRW